MSITSDLRAYADTAVNQGKQVFDTAQAQLNDYTGQANDLVGKTRENVADIADKAAHAMSDVRHSAEKAVNLDALTAAVEPYLAQLKEYTSVVTDKVEGLLSTVSGARNDKRVSALVERVEPVIGAVYELAQERVVKPVQSLTGFGKTTKPAAKPSPKPTKAAAPKAARKPAATKPASKPVAPAASTSATTSATAPAEKPAARKTATKRVAKS